MISICLMVPSDIPGHDTTELWIEAEAVPRVGEFVTLPPVVEPAPSEPTQRVRRLPVSRVEWQLASPYSGKNRYRPIVWLGL